MESSFGYKLVLVWSILKVTMNSSMTVGAFEAKTRLSQLLEHVRQGAEITITKHDKPVAKLVPFEKPTRVELTELFRRMDEFCVRHPLNPKGMPALSYRELIDGGRKR